MENRNEYLKQDLADLRKKLDMALEKYDELFSFTKEGIMIDNEVDGYDSFKDIENKINEVRNKLINDIIPKVNNSL